MINIVIACADHLALTGLCSYINWGELHISICGTAYNGREAMLLIEQKNPEIVLTETHLPEIDGPEIAARCKERFGRLPVFVFLSETEDFGTLKSALTVGAADFLIKSRLDQNTLRDAMIRAGEEVRVRQTAQKEDNDKNRKLKLSPNAVLTAVKAYIEENYDKPLSLSGISSVFNYNSNYISHLFTRHGDKSFVGFLTSVRIEAAKKLMSEQDTTVARVASAVGYGNQFYFSRVFSEETGMSPKEYMKGRKIGKTNHGAPQTKCEISVMSSKGAVRQASEKSEFPVMAFRGNYDPGDYILVKTDARGKFWEVRIEDSIPPAIVYIAGDTLRFDIPFNEQRIPYSPKSFTGHVHMLSVREANPDTVYARRNLALNPLDCVSAKNCYPHASANIETRGEAIFAARNVIDGLYANDMHGEYPYTSWGINRDPNALLRIDFGVSCVIDELVITLRADFPHDSYWTSAGVDFSDGSSETFEFLKTEKPQKFSIKPRTVSWFTLSRLIKADDESPFPALTQIEAWGKVAK